MEVTPPNPNTPKGSASPSGSDPSTPGQNRNRIILTAIVMVVVLAVIIVPGLVKKSNTTQLTYNSWLTQINDKQVKTATVDQSNGTISGILADGTNYAALGPNPVTDSEQTALKTLGANAKYVTTTQSPLVSLIWYLIPFALIMGVF